MRDRVPAERVAERKAYQLVAARKGSHAKAAEQDLDLQVVVVDLVGQDAAPLVAAGVAVLLGTVSVNAQSLDAAAGKDWLSSVGSAGQRRKNGEARRTACLLSQQASLDLGADRQTVFRSVHEMPSPVSVVAQLELRQTTPALLASAADLAYDFAQSSRDHTTADWRMSQRTLAVAVAERFAEALAWQQAEAAVQAMRHVGARQLRLPSLPA